MVVKNKKKFIRAIILIVGLTIGIVLIMTSESLSHQDIKYKSVSVSYGDTLWDIAKSEQQTNDYYKERDVRDIVANIKKANKLEKSNLTIGQVLEIPTY